MPYILLQGKKYKGQHTTMGMAASQARLLTLTSRLHDIEYKAQNIESQKIALATQKDEVFQIYNDAMDAKKIQVAYDNGDGTKSFVDANFSNVCGYSQDRARQYALTDSRTGKVIVDDNTAQMYETFDNDKYGFAWAMMGFDASYSSFGNEDYEMDMIGSGNTSAAAYSDEGSYVIMSEVEQMVYDKYADSDSKLKTYYDDVCNARDNGTITERKEALDAFRNYLYTGKEGKYAKEIYSYMRINKEQDQYKDPESATEHGEMDTDFPDAMDKSEFNYYVYLFELIQDAGGCTTIDPQYTSGDEANTWFNNMVSSGRVIISEFNPNQPSKGWKETSVATSTNGNYLKEVQDDAGLKKAEAEYEHELDIINRKDTKFDKELKNLETERTAITTEIESIDKVKGDNIERTFGIFS